MKLMENYKDSWNSITEHSAVEVKLKKTKHGKVIIINPFQNVILLKLLNHRYDDMFII